MPSLQRCPYKEGFRYRRYALWLQLCGYTGYIPQSSYMQILQGHGIPEYSDYIQSNNTKLQIQKLIPHPSSYLYAHINFMLLNVSIYYRTFTKTGTYGQCTVHCTQTGGGSVFEVSSLQLETKECSEVNYLCDFQQAALFEFQLHSSMVINQGWLI